MTDPQIPAVISERTLRRRAEAARAVIWQGWPGWALPALQPLPQTGRQVRLARFDEPVIGMAASMAGDQRPEAGDLPAASLGRVT